MLKLVFELIRLIKNHIPFRRKTMSATKPTPASEPRAAAAPQEVVITDGPYSLSTLVNDVQAKGTDILVRENHFPSGDRPGDRNDSKGEDLSVALTLQNRVTVVRDDRLTMTVSAQGADSFAMIPFQTIKKTNDTSIGFFISYTSVREYRQLKIQEAAPSKLSTVYLMMWDPLFWGPALLDFQGFLNNFESDLKKQQNKNLVAAEKRILEAIPDPQFLELSRFTRSVLQNSLRDIVKKKGDEKIIEKGFKGQIGEGMAEDIAESFLLSVFVNLAETLNKEAANIPKYKDQNALANLLSLFIQKISKHIPSAKVLADIEDAEFQSKRLEEKLKHLMNDNKDAKKALVDLISPDENGNFLKNKFKMKALKRLFKNYDQLTPDELKDVDSMIKFGIKQNELFAICGKITNELLNLFFPNKLSSLYMEGINKTIFKDAGFQNNLFNYIGFQLSDFIESCYLPLTTNPGRHASWVNSIKNRIGDKQIEPITKAPTIILLEVAKNFIHTNAKALDLIAWGLHFASSSEKNESANPSQNAPVVPVAAAAPAALNLLPNINGGAPANAQPAPIPPKVVSTNELAHQPLANWILQSMQSILSSNDPVLTRAGNFVKGLFGDLTLGLLARGTELAIPAEKQVDQKEIIKHIIDQIIEQTKLMGKGKSAPSKHFWESFIQDLPLPPLALPLVATRLTDRVGQLKDVYTKFVDTNRKINDFHDESIKLFNAYPNSLKIVSLCGKIADKLGEEIFAQLNGLNTAETTKQLESQANWVESRIEGYLEKYLPGFQLDPLLKTWFKENLSTLSKDLKGISPNSDIVKKGIQSIVLRSISYLIENNTKAGEPDKFGAQLFQRFFTLFKESFNGLTGAGKVARLTELKAALAILNQIEAEKKAKGEILYIIKMCRASLDSKIILNEAERKVILNLQHAINKAEEASKNVSDMENRDRTNKVEIDKHKAGLSARLPEFRQALAYQKLRNLPSELEELKTRIKFLKEALKPNSGTKIELKPDMFKDQQNCEILVEFLSLPAKQLDMLHDCLNMEFTLPHAKKLLEKHKVDLRHAEIEFRDTPRSEGILEATATHKMLQDQKTKLIDVNNKVDQLESQLDDNIKPFLELSNNLFNIMGLGDKNKFIPDFVWERAQSILEGVRTKQAPRILFEQLYPVLLPILEKEMNQVELTRLTGNDVLVKLCSAVTKEVLNKSPDMLSGAPDWIADSIEKFVPGSSAELKEMFVPQLKALLANADQVKGSKEVIEAYIEGVLLLCFIQAAKKKQGAANQQEFIKGLIDQVVTKVKSIGSKNESLDKLWDTFVVDLPIPQFVKSMLVKRLVAQSAHVQELFENITKIENFHSQVKKEVEVYKNGKLLISAAEKISAKAVQKLMDKLNKGETLDAEFIERHLENLIDQFLPGMEIEADFKTWLKLNINLIRSDLTQISNESSNLFKKGLEAALLKSLLHIIKSIDKEDSVIQAAPIFDRLYKAFKGSFTDLNVHRANLEQAAAKQAEIAIIKRQKETLVKEIQESQRQLGDGLNLDDAETAALAKTVQFLDKRVRALRNGLELEAELKTKLEVLNKGLPTSPWTNEKLAQIPAPLLNDAAQNQLWQVGGLGEFNAERIHLVRVCRRMLTSIEHYRLEKDAVLVNPVLRLPVLMDRLTALSTQKFKIVEHDNTIDIKEEEGDKHLKFFQDLSDKFVGLLDLKDLPSIVQKPLAFFIDPIQKKYIPRVLFDQLYPMLLPILQREESQKRLRDLTGNDFFGKLSLIISDEIIKKGPEVLDKFPLEITNAIESIVPGDALRFQALIIPQLKIILSETQDADGGRAIIHKYVEGILLKVFIHVMEKKQSAADQKAFIKGLIDQSIEKAKLLAGGEKLETIGSSYIKELPIPPFVQDLILSSIASKSEMIQELFKAITRLENFYTRRLDEVRPYKNGPFLISLTDKISELAVTEMLKKIRSSKLLDADTLEGTIREIFDKYLPGLPIDDTFKTWLKDNNALFEQELKKVSDDPTFYKKAIQGVLLKAFGKIIPTLKQEELDKWAAPIFNRFYTNFKDLFKGLKGDKDDLEDAAIEHQKLTLILQSREVTQKRFNEVQKSLQAHPKALQHMDQLSGARKYLVGLNNRLENEPENKERLERYVKLSNEKIARLEQEFSQLVNGHAQARELNELEKLLKELAEFDKKIAEAEESLDECLSFFKGRSKDLAAFVGLNDETVVPELLRDSVWPIVESVKQKQVPRLMFEQIYPIALPVLKREDYQRELKTLTKSNFLQDLANSISNEVVKQSPTLLNEAKDKLIQTLETYIPGEAAKLHALVIPQLTMILNEQDDPEGGRVIVQQYIEGILLKAFIQTVKKNESNSLESVFDKISSKVKLIMASDAVKALYVEKEQASDAAAKVVIQDKIENLIATSVIHDILGMNEQAIIGMPDSLKKTVLENLQVQVKKHVSPFISVLRDKAADQAKLREASPYLADLCKAVSRHAVSFIAPTMVKTYQAVAEKMINELSQVMPQVAELSADSRKKVLDDLSTRIAQIAKNANPTDKQAKSVVVKNKILLEAFKAACEEGEIEVSDENNQLLLAKIKASNIKYDLRSIVITPDSIVESIVKGFPGITPEMKAELTLVLHRLAAMGAKSDQRSDFVELSQEYLEVILQKLFIDIAQANKDNEGKKDVSIVIVEKTLKLVQDRYLSIREEFTKVEGQANSEVLKKEIVERVASELTTGIIADVFGIDKSKMKSIKDLPEPIQQMIFDLFQTQIHGLTKNLLVSFSEQIKTLDGSNEEVKQHYADLNNLLETTFSEQAVLNISRSTLDATLTLMNESLEQEGGVKLKKGTVLSAEGYKAYLENLLRAHMPIAGFLLDYPFGSDLAKNVDSYIPGKERGGTLAKLGAASLVANFIVKPLNTGIKKLVDLEKTKGVEFNTKLGTNLLKATTTHLKIVNAAKKKAGKAAMSHADFVAAGTEAGLLHPALPVSKPTYEKSIQQIEDLIGVKLDAAKALKAFEALADKDKTKVKPLSTDHIIGAVEQIFGEALTNDQKLKLKQADKAGALKEAIREDALATSNQRIQKLYNPVMKKLLKACFPNGENDLTFVPKEVRGTVWRQFKSQGHLLMSSMVENILDPDNITTMVISSLETMRDNLRESPEVDFTPPRTVVTEQDEACGELLLQVLDLTKLPSWMVKMMIDPKTGKVTDAMKIKLGSLMKKQFDGKFIQKNFKLAIEKVAAKDAKGGSIVDYDMREASVKEAEMPGKRKLQEAKLDKTILECVDATVKYQIKSYVKHKMAAIDANIERIFGKNKIVNAGIKGIFGILTSFIWAMEAAVLFFVYYMPTTKYIAAWWIGLDENKKILMDMLRKGPIDQPEKAKHAIFNEELVFRMIEGFANSLEE